MLEIDCPRSERLEADRERLMEVWREAEAHCGRALTKWSQASRPSERAAAFAVYQAGLEREEHIEQAFFFRVLR